VLGSSLRTKQQSDHASLAIRARASFHRIPHAAHGNDRYKIYMGYWFFGRPTVEDLCQDLRAVLKKCRPDWDITTSEMKTAWHEGRKELFYPYGKTFAETIREQD
jgi:hypothetical protein